MGEDTHEQGERASSEERPQVGNRESSRERRAEVTESRFEGPVFVISTADLSFVQGNTEAHYVARLFGEAVETHVFAPLSSDLPDVESHAYPFGGVVGVFLLNVVFLPYWLYVAKRERPRAVYCYGNVILPPFVVRAVSGSAVVYDLQADPHDQMQEFADQDGGSPLLAPLLVGVKLAHRLALPRSDAVLTLSDHLKRRIQRNYGVSAENVHVVPLGVDTDKFSPRTESANSSRAKSTDGSETEPTDASDERKVADRSDRLRIAYLGTILHFRGLETVVSALARLDDERRRRVQFDIFGAGDEEFLAELRRTADASDVELVYHGHVDHEAVPAALSECDVAVSPLPALDSFQVSCPAKVFEYLSMGLPIVATRIPPHEHLTDGENAVLVDPDDPAAFAAAFKRLLDDPEALASMASTARRTALDHDWSDRFRRITAIVAMAQADRREGVADDGGREAVAEEARAELRTEQ